ncbi:MBL fold metallo-hydrolase [Halosimplex marinum]|uniref:MBL fold metallo-hydrolase n=1 Tax=Halosimplex marinum TaxID=3396620 RepID=UPI003F565102
MDTSEFYYYGDKEINEISSSSNSTRLAIPQSVYEDDRVAPLIRGTEVQFFRDEEFFDHVIIGPLAYDSERFDPLVKFNETFNLGDRVTITQISNQVAEFTTDQRVHLLSDPELLDSGERHIYLVTSEQLNRLIDRGWQPSSWLDISRMENVEKKDELTPVDAPVEVDPIDNSGERMSVSEVRVEILGSTQGGGIPHLDCSCAQCDKEWSELRRGRMINSMLMEHNGDPETLLFEATPDIRYQIKTIPDHIFISHDLAGHLSGLLAFSVESINASGIEVHCHPEVADLLAGSGVFQRLIQEENIILEPLTMDESLTISSIDITVSQVPYTWGETDPLTYTISGPDRNLFYAPHLMEWSEDLVSDIADADIAIIDGLLWTDREVNAENVPHVPIPDVLDRLSERNIDTDIRFTNLNHSNKALRDERKLQTIKENGGGIVEYGGNYYL